MMRRKFACSESVDAAYHRLLSPLVFGAGELVDAGHFAGFLAAKRRAAPSVWHPGVSSSIYFCCRLAKCEELRCVDFLKEIL
jgi:hypothetical protein